MDAQELQELVDFLRGLAKDHEPHGWPAVQMRQITALVDEIDRLRADRDSWAQQASDRTQDALDLMAAVRERWMAAATAASQELCHCAPWSAGGQAFAALRELIDGPNVELTGPRAGDDRSTGR